MRLGIQCGSLPQTLGVLGLGVMTMARSSWVKGPGAVVAGCEIRRSFAALRMTAFLGGGMTAFHLRAALQIEGGEG